MSDNKFDAAFQPQEKCSGSFPGVEKIQASHVSSLDVYPGERRFQLSLASSNGWTIHLAMSLLCLIVFALGCSGDSSSDHEAEITLAINKLRMELQDNLGQPVPALSVFIQTPTETVFASAANTPEEAITKDTYFRIASTTKALTSTAVLLMQNYGWLNISHFITDMMPAGNKPYIPDTPDYDIKYKT